MLELGRAVALVVAELGRAETPLLLGRAVVVLVGRELIVGRVLTVGRVETPLLVGRTLAPLPVLPLTPAPAVLGPLF